MCVWGRERERERERKKEKKTKNKNKNTLKRLRPRCGSGLAHLGCVCTDVHHPHPHLLTVPRMVPLSQWMVVVPRISSSPGPQSVQWAIHPRETSPAQGTTFLAPGPLLIRPGNLIHAGPAFSPTFMQQLREMPQAPH